MMWLLSILYFISIMVLSRSFVITKYGPEDLTEYFHKIRDYSNRKGIVNDSSADDFFAGLDLFEYCHKLRQSITYKMVNTMDIQPVNYVDRVITKQQLESEKDKIEIEKLSLRVINLRNQLLKLNAFRCLDLEGAPRWITTPGYIPQSAFLFTYELTFRNIEAKNLNTSKETLVNLIGVIDDSATTYPRDRTIRAGRESVEDQLRNLHPIIQYRLCALVGDSIRRNYRNEEITSMGDNITTQNYRGSSVDSRYYVGHPNMGNTITRGKIRISFRTQEMLYCPITIPDFMMNSSFYLRQNIRDPTRVLVVWYTSSIAVTSVIACDVEVPLLKYVSEYQKALTNDN